MGLTNQFLDEPVLKAIHEPKLKHLSSKAQEFRQKKKIKLLTLIAKSRRRQELYMQTLGDAVLLAANQVQDKRLELLEQEPEVTGTEIFLDIMLAIVFSSDVAGKLLKTFAKKLLNPILRTPLAFKILPKTKQGQNFFEEIAGSQLGKVGTSKVTASFLKNAELSKLYKNVVFEVAESAAGSIRHIPKEFKVPEAQEDLVIGDSTGVGIMNLVQRALREKIQGINLAHDYLEIAIQNDLMDDDSTNELLQLLNENIIEDLKKEKYDLGAIKEKFMLFYESCIWLMVMEPKLGRPVSGNFIRIIDKKGEEVDERLIEYWLNRFHHPKSDNESFKQYAKRVVKINVDTTLRAKQELGEYFMTLNGQIKDMKENVEKAAKKEGPGFALLKPAISKRD